MIRRALRRLGGFLFAPATRYFNRRFEDVHRHLDQTSAELAAVSARLARLESRDDVDLAPVEELMVLVHQEVRRLHAGDADGQ